MEVWPVHRSGARGDHMARWVVNRNDTSFGVSDVAELCDLARKGALAAGDLVQPPGSTGWLYAQDVPDVRKALEARGPGVVDVPVVEAGGSWGNVVVGAMMVIAILALGNYTWQRWQLIPDGTHTILGEGGLSFSELVVTSSGIQLLSEPEARSGAVKELTKDTVLELLAKRGDFYKAREKTGGEGAAQGWVAADKVLPVYLLGGGDVRNELDPLYNPDRYLEVANASWMQLPEARKRKVTVFQFLLSNTSDYDMTDLVMVARLKDSKGHEVNQVEFRVEGVVPGQDDTMVGTIVDPKTEERRLITQVSFAAMAAQNPDLRLQYTEGVEVKMEQDEFNEASIDIVELRAIPKDGQ